MSKKLGGGATSPRRKAVWVSEFHHRAVNVCASIEGVTSGEFLERILGRYISENRNLHKACKEIKGANQFVA